MAKRKYNELSSEEKKNFRELDMYIRTNVMGYSPNQGLTGEMAQRLMGMRYRQYIGNNNSYRWCNYSFGTILNTYKACSIKIKNGMQGKHFKNDMQRFNYAAKIVENNLAEVYEREQYAKQSREEAKRKDIAEQTVAKNVEYKPKQKKNKDRFSDLW